MRRAQRVVLGAVAVAAIGLGGFALSRTSLLDAHHIRVIGNHHLSAGQVERLAGISGKTNVLWMNAGSVTERLMTDPWISSASVGRNLPWTVSIDISERVPVGIEGSGADARLVASDGTILGRPGGAARLPKLASGAGSVKDAALTLASFPSNLLKDVASATGSAGSTVTILLKGGTKVDFGTVDQAVSKVQALGAVLDWAAARHVGVLSVDVSAPSAPTAKLQGGAVVSR
jgi:cell division protein FtsQ